MRIIQKMGSRRLRSQSTVEVALVLPLLIFMILGMIDFSYIMFGKQTFANAVRVAGRIGSTGRILTTNEIANGYTNILVTTTNGVTYTWVADPTTPTRPMSREQSILAILEQNLSIYSQFRTNIVGTINTVGGVNQYVTIKTWTSANAAPALGPGERTDDNITTYFTVSVRYPVTLLTGLNAIGNFFGPGMVFESNQFYITSTNVFISESFNYTNMARWTN